MEKKPSTHDLILKTLREKSSMKQDVYEKTVNAFNVLKSTALEIVNAINSDNNLPDKRVIVEYRERGQFEFELRISGDLLIFAMHTNIFEFDKSHLIWRGSYLRDDPFRSFCGMINVYNFLNDSFRYHRINDLGYLIGRIFINKENHYFLEGKRQLGFLYNDFSNATMDQQAAKSLIESIVLYCLNFDLYSPPFDSIKEISVSDMMAASESMQIKTGKRLGFRFQSDSDDVV